MKILCLLDQLYLHFYDELSKATLRYGVYLGGLGGGVIGQKMCRIMIQINVYHLQEYVRCAVFVDEQYV